MRDRSACLIDDLELPEVRQPKVDRLVEPNDDGLSVERITVDNTVERVDSEHFEQDVGRDLKHGDISKVAALNPRSGSDCGLVAPDDDPHVVAEGLHRKSNHGRVRIGDIDAREP